MKNTMIALSFAACAVSSLAHAVTPRDVSVDQSTQTQRTPSIASSGHKTLAQVRQELVQAEKDVQLANLNHSLYSGGV
jgi:hypothetical protein